jgi:hypothetical protein
MRVDDIVTRSPRTIALRTTIGAARNVLRTPDVRYLPGTSP